MPSIALQEIIAVAMYDTHRDQAPAWAQAHPSTRHWHLAAAGNVIARLAGLGFELPRYFDLSEVDAGHLHPDQAMQKVLDELKEGQRQMAATGQQILDAINAEDEDIAKLIALAQSQQTAMTDLQQKLAAAVAANQQDPNLQAALDAVNAQKQALDDTLAGLQQQAGTGGAVDTSGTAGNTGTVDTSGTAGNTGNTGTV